MSKAKTGTQSGRILVVDDTTGNLRLLENLLTEQGYTVHPASDGKLALRFVQEILPDLILLDIRMSGMDGYEVCRQLKADERTRSIPVIFISILEQEHDKVKGFQEGAVDYITKPFQPEEVLARVRTHLCLRELTERLEHKVVERTEELLIANQRLQQELAERRRAEEALRESEERYRLIVNTATEGILVLGPDLMTTFANPRMAEIIGYPSEEIIGRPLTDFMFDEDISDHLLRMERRRKGVSENYERRFRRKDGETVWTLCSATAIWKAERRFNGSFGMFTDITERKLAAEAVSRANKDWEQTFNSIPDMVMVLDRQHRILRANNAMATALGESEEELKGRLCFELFHNTDKPPAFCPHSILLKDGKVHSTELFEPKFGRSLDIRVSPLSDETGTVIRSVHIMRDITEQKSLQKQLLQAQKMESIGTLAGGIAHDFNNLLQVIIGYSDMLLFNKKPSDSAYEELRAIHQAGKDGGELAKRILAFSRRLEPNSRPVDLNNEIKRIRKMLDRTLPKMIRIQILLVDKLMTVNADPGQLEQIILNLAVNAQHAMADGGRLTIETANVTLDEHYSRTHLGVEQGKYVLLAVSDTGHGMNKEVMEHIFEPFYTTKGPGVGTGLGLAMVFGIVKNHKGHITCYSEPGTGTTFKIYLPAIVREVEQDPAVTRQMPAFGTETILLVDDEESIRKLGEQMLRMAGYKVLMATNGIEALEVYRSNQDRIALVLLDLMMPEMGGKQCLEELLKINPKVKVIIASGYSANGPTKDSVEADAKGFVSKPYDTRQLLEIVRRVLDAE